MKYSSIINKFKSKTILVVGDIMLDKYIFGTTSRISPEAPVPVINKSRELLSPGGSANVANNLKQLSVKTFLVGTVGNDDSGKDIIKLLRDNGFDLKNIIRDSRKPTTVKTRLISDGQQIARIDNEDSSVISTSVQNQLLNRISRIIRAQKPDAIIISDYNKGLITNKICKEIIKLAGKFNVFVAVDPKGDDFLKYSGADLITPNIKEAEFITGLEISNERRIKAALKKILTISKTGSAIITRGKDGLSYINDENKFKTVPAQKVNVYDVTGAGDTFIAVFIISLIVSHSWEASAGLANLASSIVVSTVGTTFSTTDELLRATTNKNETSKIIKMSELKIILASSKNKGNIIVFTNGCFDLLHLGHIKILKESKKLGDTLIVGINSDSSVKKLKGKGRPVVKAVERTHLIALMEEVDFVVVFNELTPLELIRELRPDIITKGGDYKKSEIVGSKFVESYGGKVKIIPLLKSHSTSNLLINIQKS